MKILVSFMTNVHKRPSSDIIPGLLFRVVLKVYLDKNVVIRRVGSVTQTPRDATTGGTSRSCTHKSSARRDGGVAPFFELRAVLY